MTAENSATATSRIAVADPSGTPAPAATGTGTGTLQAALGVIAFSLTFPATAWGLEGFGPWSLVAVRSVLAGLIAGGCLLAVGARAVGAGAAGGSSHGGVPARWRVWRVPLPARRHLP